MGGQGRWTNRLHVMGVRIRELDRVFVALARAFRREASNGHLTCASLRAAEASGNLPGAAGPIQIPEAWLSLVPVCPALKSTLTHPQWELQVLQRSPGTPPSRYRSPTSYGSLHTYANSAGT